MADHTHIEWTDATWNPITGCSVVSPGCTNCYAMRLAGTRLRHHPSRAGLTQASKAGPVWTGGVRLNEQWLDQPLRWKAPRRIFVCAHGDLFHEAVPFEVIDRVFARMALSRRHTYQVLTKRAARMRAYMTGGAADRVWRLATTNPVLSTPGMQWNGAEPWPLPNVWLGVSAEDQARADERIPDLLVTPAAVRFVSLEPLLGPVNLTRIGPGPAEDEEVRTNALTGNWSTSRYDEDGIDGPALDWVIVGGESGPGARPMHPEWARQIRDACAAAGVAFFFKQWGAWHPMGQLLNDGSINCMDKGERHGLWHAPTMSVNIGKTAAGRTLDSVTHDGMPA